MSTLSRNRLRLAFDTASTSQVIDTLTSEPPSIWRGTDLQIEAAFFQQGALLDISNLASVTLDVKPYSPEGLSQSPVMTSTVEAADAEFTASPSASGWDDGTAEHARFIFDAGATNIDLDGQAEATFWLVVSAATVDDPIRYITLGSALLLVREDGARIAASTPVNDPLYLTAAETGAQFQARSERNQPEGYAGLDSGGLVPAALLPATSPTIPDNSIEPAKLAGFVVIRKPVDQTVANTTSPQDDDHLQFTIGTNELWEFRAWVSYSEWYNGNGLTLGVGAPTTPAEYAISIGGSGIATPTALTFAYGNFVQTATYSADAGLATIAGVVRHSAAMTLSIRWAQRISGQEATTVHTGSALVARRLS